MTTFTLNKTQDGKLRVSLGNRSRVIEDDSLLYVLEDLEQVVHCEEIEPEFFDLDRTEG